MKESSLGMTWSGAALLVEFAAEFFPGLFILAIIAKRFIALLRRDDSCVGTHAIA
jgi:hypothetical protein